MNDKAPSRKTSININDTEEALLTEIFNNTGKMNRNSNNSNIVIIVIIVKIKKIEC